MRSLAWCLVLAACGKDVRLGSAPDAAVDAALSIDGHPGNPFATGTYALAFVDPPDVMCDGELASMEASFAALTRATLNLIDGTVTLDAPTATQLVVTGAALGVAFGDSALTLMPEPDPPPGEPELWGVEVAQSFGAGPLSTTNTRRILVLDSGSAGAARIDAIGAALFENAAQTGTCTVLFAASLTPQ
ncbi:MAG: hypothetical protein SFX73_00330 [Kofleriaceae bacterium]|nr:hypothetical protein [Kofleriaceae bacterium]